jgi:hypothetical protein
MFDSETAGKRWRALVRGLGSFAVAYFFIVTILVATAQQRVAEALDAQNVGYDYNVAIRYYFKPDELAGKSLAHNQTLIEQRARLRDLESEKAQLERNLARQAAILRNRLTAIAASECSLPALTEDPASLIAAVPVAEECLASRGGESNVSLQRLVQAAMKEATQADNIMDELDSNRAKAAHQAEHITSLEETAASFKSQLESIAKSSNIMAVLDLFQQKCAWKIGCWPGTGVLVHVPPTLMAIFVAFSSGMFGALLITLVLYVYPDNRYSFTRSHSFGGRILLGGLIALGVFVLLFSGVAVLGGSDNAAEGSHNVMAYSAIGILCGMFSDQAAAWLSGQAATLLKQQQERQAREQDEDPVTP